MISCKTKRSKFRKLTRKKNRSDICMTVGGITSRGPSSLRDLLKRAKEDKIRTSKSDIVDTSLCSFEEMWKSREDVPDVNRNFCANLSGLSISNIFLSVELAKEVQERVLSNSESFEKLRGRTCLPLGGKVTATGLIPRDDIPSWLSSLMDDVHKHVLAPLSLPRPNHALINAYEPGEGIMAHEDGPAYTPYATILSLGSGCVFDFVSKSIDRAPIARIYLPVGSLLLFTDDAYKEVLHEFKAQKLDFLSSDVLNASPLDSSRLGASQIRDSDGVLVRGRRVSITMRHVSTV